MGVIKTLAVGLGIITAGGAVAMAVPDVRNTTLDWIAPKSNIYKTQEKDLANTKENLENTTKELEATKLTLVDTLSQVENLMQEKTTLVGQVNDLSKQIKTKDSQIETLNNQLTSTKQDLDTQTAYLETCQNKAIEIKSQIETLSQEDTQANALELSTLQTDLENIQTEVTKVENKINTLNATVSSLNTSIATLTAEKQELQTSVTNLNSQISAKDTEIESLNAEIVKLNSQVASLQEQVNNLSNSGVSFSYTSYDVGFLFVYKLNKDTYQSVGFESFKTFINGGYGYNNSNVHTVHVTYDGRGMDWNCPLDCIEFSPIYKLQGVDKTKEEMLEYLSTCDTNSDVQLEVNLSSDRTTLTINVINFPLTGRYVSVDGQYFDFDNLQTSGYKNIDSFLLSEDSEDFRLYIYCENGYVNCLPTFKIISNTQIEHAGKTYTKVNEDNAVAFELGSYVNGGSTYVFAENGSLSVGGVDGGYWFINEDKLIIHFENNIMVSTITSSTTFELNGNTYTKSTDSTDSSETEDVTLPAKFVGNYTSTEDFETVSIGTSTMGYSSSPLSNLIKFENNVASFDGFGDIPFTENSDGTISLVYGGKTYTKQTEETVTATFIEGTYSGDAGSFTFENGNYSLNIYGDESSGTYTYSDGVLTLGSGEQITMTDSTSFTYLSYTFTLVS